MAEVRTSILGGIKGRIGAYILRIRYGKQITYSRPLKQKVSKSVKAKTARNNFAATVALAKSVNAVPKLKEVWRNAKVPGTNSYQRLIKNNAKLVREGLLTTRNIITPEGLPLILNSASIENDKLSLSFDCPAGSDVSFPAVLFAYLYFEKESGANSIFFKEISEPAPGGSYSLETVIDPRTIKLLTNDSEPILYTALIGGTPSKKKVYWTSTAAVRL